MFICSDILTYDLMKFYPQRVIHSWRCRIIMLSIIADLTRLHAYSTYIHSYIRYLPSPLTPATPGRQPCLLYLETLPTRAHPLDAREECALCNNEYKISFLCKSAISYICILADGIPCLRHRTVCSRHNQNCTIHLEDDCDSGSLDGARIEVHLKSKPVQLL